MAQESDQEKSLPATQRRIEKAREEGQVARSPELATAAVLGGGALMLAMAGPMLLDKARALLTGGLRLAREDAYDAGRIAGRLAALTSEGLFVVLGAGLLLAAGAAGAMLAIGGWNFTLNAITPQPERLSPGRWLSRSFSLAGAGEIAKTAVKALALGAVAAAYVWAHRDHVAGLAAAPLPAALAVLGGMVLGLLGAVAFAALGVAAIDVPFQLWRHRSNLKMSLQEVKEENRETEGDPMLKARIRSQQREMARRRMMSEVPKADVIVTNPTHYAVALAYREGEMAAPRVVAKGTELVAARIRELGAAAGVPTLEAPPLARALHKHAEVGEEIPAPLYGAVAQVLAWVFAIRAGVPGTAAPAGIDVPAGMDPASADLEKTA